MSQWLLSAPARTSRFSPFSGRYAWLNAFLSVALPLAVLGSLAVLGPESVVRAAQILAALLVVAVIARRPGPSLALLIVFVPLQVVGLALLLHLGVPAAAIRALGGLKDALVVGLTLNAVWNLSRHPRRFDAVDKLALAYLGFVLLYLFAPSVVTGLLGNQSFNVRLLAARQDGLFAVALLAARHADISAAWRARIPKVLLGVAVPMSICALINVIFPTTWNHFLVNVAEVPRYRAEVLGVFTNPQDVLNRGSIGGHDIIRAGSLVLNELTLGFYLVIALGICLERMTTRRLTARFVVLTIACFAAIVVTATRSAILAAIIALFAAIRVAAVRKAPGWLRLVLLLVIAAFAIAPVSGSTTAGERGIAGITGQDPSTQEHAKSSSGAFDNVISSPLGSGLGTAASIGQRFDVKGRVTSEDAYLQVGNELGVGTAVAFIGLYAAVLLALRRRARSDDDTNHLAAGMFAAGIGLAVGGLFLQIWQDYATSLTFWALAGLALVPRPPDRPETAPSTTSAQPLELVH